MYVWSNPPTIIRRRFALLLAGLLTLFVALSTTLLFADASLAAPGINQRLSFQGRLLSSSGGLVPDGRYNMQFKIYKGGTGSVAGNPTGALAWTENYVNNNANQGVTIKNGYFSVELGSVTPFGTSVDWNDDTLWLSMNIAGSAAACTTFGTSPCVADGEMLPMKRITSVPYSLNSSAVGGKSVDQLTQLGQGVQTDSTSQSSIAINKTGSGDLLHLQGNGINALTLDKIGNMNIGGNLGITGALTLGNTLSASAGTLRWTGTEFQGYDGTKWVSLSAGGSTGSTVSSPTQQTITKTKTVNENITSNTTLQNDDELFFAVGASQVWTYRFTVQALGGTTGGLKFTVTAPTGSTCTYGVSDVESAVGAGNIACGTASANITGNGTADVYEITGTVRTSTTAGNVQLQWSQGATSVTASTVYAGSSVTANRELPVNGATVNGDNISILGGNAAGTNGNGGNITIDGGTKNGTGVAGTITIGGTNASDISLGTKTSAIAQNITIGTNNTTGSSTNITIGAGNGATSGTTAIRAKDNITLNTNGVDRVTISGTTSVATFGNGELSNTPSNFTIQGTNSSATAAAGGSLTLKGGNATVGNANGGNITLAGGTGVGTGTSGLVVINTPTLATAMSDANCYTSGAVVTTSCTITAASINNSSAVMVGVSTTGRTITLPDPAQTTAGRMYYVIAASNSQEFVLARNGGGVSNETVMLANTSTALMWNGVDWIVTGTSSSNHLMGTRERDNILRNVQIGSGTDDGNLSLLTMDKAASAPTVNNTTAMLGSMYYDTTLGKVQCYEADGWGSCSAAPDTFVTLTPQYANAVFEGSGTINSGFCSDALNVNDGSSSQATICGTNEAHNYYSFTDAGSTTATKSIYVNYKLPSNFKKFVTGSMSLMGRTDSTNSNVDYQVYRKQGSTDLVTCGSTQSVSTGVQTTWQTTTSLNTSDPANCPFNAGDSVVIRIDLRAKSNAKAYVGNLSFAFSNN